MERWTQVLTVELGGEALEMAPAIFPLSCWAKLMLASQNFKVSETPTRVSVAIVTPRELGLLSPSVYREILARAKEQGLDICPAEVGPRLRLQYDQPNKEEVVVAMEEIVISLPSVEIPCRFLVKTERGKWIEGIHIPEKTRLSLDTKFAFAIQ